MRRPQDLYIMYQGVVERPQIIFTIDHIEKHIQHNESFDFHVTLMIHTSGGHASEPFHFYNYIKARNIHLTTYNLGIVGSAGIELFLCGEERICPPYSEFKLHESYFSMQNNLTASQLSDLVKKSEQRFQKRQEFVQERTGLSDMSFYEQWTSKDTSVFPDEALEKNICNRIGYINIPQSAMLKDVRSPDFGEK